jgi:predicted site-specific integrase-resolvase
MQSNPKPYISPRELAAALGLTKPTVIHWLNRGWVQHTVLPNGRRIIPATELERLLSKAIQTQDTATKGETQ